MPLDPHLERAIRDRISRSAFRRWMGLELVSIGEGVSEVALDIEPHHRNPGGLVHGGVIATMLDAAIGLALRTRLGLRDEHVTLALNVHYVSAARTGRLVARGSAVRSGARASYGEADLVSEEGVLVARGAASFLTVPGPRAEAGR